MSKPSKRSPRIPQLKLARQFRAIASPVRNQIFGIITGSHAAKQEAGLSIREIANQLGRNPASLYRHIDVLLEADLIYEVGTRPSARRDAAVYAASDSAVLLAPPKGDGAAMDAVCEYIERTSAHAAREAAAAVRDGTDKSHVRAPDDRAGISAFGWLDDAQRARLKAIQYEIAEIFRDAERREGTRLMSVAYMYHPTRLPDGGVADEPDGAFAKAGKGHGTHRD